jgi:hypothetical protein
MSTSGVTGVGIIGDLNDAVEALEAKIGVNTSAVATSLDYKLTNASSANPGHTHTLVNGATNVTATYSELNILSGVTATAAEINKLDGVNASTAELNITDGGETTEKVLNVQPKCLVTKSADQDDLTNGTPTLVTFDTEAFDVGSDFAANKFTAPVSGYYVVCGGVEFENATVVADKSYGVMIYVNGALYNGMRCFSHASHTAWINSVISGIVYLAATSYVQLYAESFAGVNTTDIDKDGTFFSVHLLSV